MAMAKKDELESAILRAERDEAREALEDAESFFRQILGTYDNPIPIHAKNSLWRDRAAYMAKCAKSGEERTRAALGKRGEG